MYAPLSAFPSNQVECSELAEGLEELLTLAQSGFIGGGAF